MTLSRRDFLRAAALAAGGTLASCASRDLRQELFTLGVASGDPTSDGVALWTRLAPAGGMPTGPVPVAWTIAEDERFSKVARSGEVNALPELAHSVHVEAAGLAPDRPYWYRFRVGDQESPVGRTRTLPAADVAASRLRFALASCQHLEHGWFGAYTHMLKEDVDLVFHVGDYIYEGAGVDKKVRKHLGKECKTLEEYRQRYAQYKADPDLMAMHAVAPWLVTTDDHEFDNNCAGDISEEKDVDKASFLRRRAAAYQAYYEHMPLRRASIPQGPDMLLYRKLSWGRLAEIFVLDTRQYRTDQPCGDGNKPPCPETLDPKGTLMGAAQRDWLFDGLGRSPGAWNVLAQQVMMARVDRKPGDGVTHSMDQWPGYEAERRRVLKVFDERKVSNPVVLAGDIHTNWANDLIADFDGLNGKTVGAEFVGTSISSGGDGPRAPKDLDKLLADNPFTRFHNTERGYVVCEVDAKRWKTDYRTLSIVTKPDQPLHTRASFVVEAGRPGIKPA